MFRKVDDFTQEWNSESNFTVKIFNALTNESLDQKVNENGRSIRQLAWHITLTLGSMLNQTGLPTGIIVNKSEKAPEIVSDIITRYQNDSRIIADAVKTNWTDEMLDMEINMFGEKWKRGVVLTALIKHQAHHRAQITVLMRQAGLKVPGVYGPAKEEWETMGMPQPE